MTRDFLEPSGGKKSAVHSGLRFVQALPSCSRFNTYGTHTRFHVVPERVSQRAVARRRRQICTEHMAGSSPKDWNSQDPGQPGIPVSPLNPGRS